MGEQYQPKISLPEIIFITPFFLFADAIRITLVFFGLSDFGLIDLFQFPASQIYLYLKGVKGTAMLVGNILDAIPYVSALPSASIVWLITIWLDRHPQIAAPISKAASLSPKLK